MKTVSIRGARRLLIGCALLVLAVIPAHAAFWNLTGSLGVHDPALTRDESAHVWWVFSTGNGISAKRSTDGLAWSSAGSVISGPLSWWTNLVPGHSNRPLDVWAPDVHFYNGKWWLYYSISTFGSNTSCIGLLSKSGALGTTGWTDDGLVIRSTGSNPYNCIDPNLTFDASGNPWLVFGSWWNGIYITPLDRTTMKPNGGLTNIAKRSGGIEGATLIFRNGFYYLFVSIDRCCAGVNSTYKIAYGRSASITGPFKDKNGSAMLNGASSIMDVGNNRWKGPGGESIFGTSVIARHAYDASDNGNPKLLISDLHWDFAGWPTYY